MIKPDRRLLRSIRSGEAELGVAPLAHRANFINDDVADREEGDGVAGPGRFEGAQAAQEVTVQIGELADRVDVDRPQTGGVGPVVPTRVAGPASVC